MAQPKRDSALNDLEKQEESLVKPLAILALGGLFQAVAGAFMLCLVYGVLVIIFRYAFHVELWNPFR